MLTEDGGRSDVGCLNSESGGVVEATPLSLGDDYELVKSGLSVAIVLVRIARQMRRWIAGELPGRRTAKRCCVRTDGRFEDESIAPHEDCVDAPNELEQGRPEFGVEPPHIDACH